MCVCVGESVYVSLVHLCVKKMNTTTYGLSLSLSPSLASTLLVQQACSENVDTI